MLIATGLALLILLFFILAILLIAPRIRRGQRVTLRPLSAYTAAHQAIARTAEQGRTTHLSTGPGALAGDTPRTAETLAGLEVMHQMARRAAATGTPLLATTGSGLAFPMAENMVRAGYAEVGRLDEVPLVGGASTAAQAVTLEGRAQGVRMLTHHDPMAYAAAAGDLAESEGVSNGVLVGGWSAEYLLVNEAQARAGVHAVAGSADPQGLATQLLTADQTLIGEEIYTAGAYLDARPAHQASLIAQDTVRVLLIIVILVGALLATVGINLAPLLGVSR
jgi:Domain of unknown function (DUF6754)